MSTRDLFEALRSVPAPMHGKRRYWRLADSRLLLEEEEVKALRAEAKHYGVQVVNARVRYLHEPMTRPMYLIELRDEEFLADARTGQPYSRETLQCATEPLMQLEGLA